jgi:hypothetical protein
MKKCIGCGKDIEENTDHEYCISCVEKDGFGEIEWVEEELIGMDNGHYEDKDDNSIQ